MPPSIRNYFCAGSARLVGPMSASSVDTLGSRGNDGQNPTTRAIVEIANTSRDLSLAKKRFEALLADGVEQFGHDIAVAISAKGF
jgi:hypothetical protein